MANNIPSANGTSDRIGNARMVSSIVGRVIHSPHSRQPVIPAVGTGYNANFQPTVPAPTVTNPLQRLPPGY